MDARQYFPHVAQRELEKNFAPYYFDGAASDANVNYPVIVLRCADENAARSLHFDALFDENALVGVSYAVRDHPGSGAPGGRAGCRILSVVEKHARVQTGRRIDGLSSDEVEELASAALQILASALEINTQLLDDHQGLQWRNCEGESRGYRLNW